MTFRARGFTLLGCEERDDVKRCAKLERGGDVLRA